nr:type II toxin-antitoxin system HicA family toxin [Halorubrum salinum]
MFGSCRIHARRERRDSLLDSGSHLKMRYESPDTDEVRIVTVPMASEDEIPTGTLQSIADQCGADDFHAWCEWIDEHR